MRKKAIIVSIKGFKLSKNEKRLFSKEKPWGLILFKRNIKSLNQIKKLIINIKKLTKHIKDQRTSGKTGCILIVSEGAYNAEGGDGLIRELNKITNFDLRITKLGHIQRGGNPSAVDRVLASRLGASAVDKLLSGSSEYVVSQPKDKIELIHFDKLVAKRQSDMKDYYELIFNLA